MVKDLPLNTLDMSELLMQFRLMRALGYHSLFDPDFQREVRNPFRRVLYYKLLNMEDALEHHNNRTLLKSQVDRLSFFTDPELYRKVRDKEEQAELKDPEVYTERITQQQQQYESASSNYRPMSEAELADAVKILKVS